MEYDLCFWCLKKRCRRESQGDIFFLSFLRYHNMKFGKEKKKDLSFFSFLGCENILFKIYTLCLFFFQYGKFWMSFVVCGSISNLSSLFGFQLAFCQCFCWDSTIIVSGGIGYWQWLVLVTLQLYQMCAWYRLIKWRGMPSHLLF